MASWKAFRVAEAIRARSLADRLAHAAQPGDAAATRTPIGCANG